jgi:hypothetical protein
MTEMQVDICKVYGQKIFNYINNLLKSKNATGKEIYLIQTMDTIPASNDYNPNVSVSKITDQVQDKLKIKMIVGEPGYTFSCIVNTTAHSVKVPLHISTVIGLHSTFGLVHTNLLQSDLPGQVIIVSGEKSVINEATEIILNPADVLLFLIVVTEKTEEAYAELTIGRCLRNDNGMGAVKWVFGSIILIVLMLILFNVFMQD